MAKKNWDSQTIRRVSAESMVSEQAIRGWLSGERGTREATVMRIKQAMKTLGLK